MKMFIYIMLKREGRNCFEDFGAEYAIERDQIIMTMLLSPLLCYVMLRLLQNKYELLNMTLW